MGPRILSAIAESGYTQNFSASTDQVSSLLADGIDEISAVDPTNLDLPSLGKILGGTELAALSGLWANHVLLHQADHS
jgi:hypothetical protein